MNKRMFALLLVLCMVASLLPARALAAGTFSDLLPEDWFYSDVQYASEHGLMNGVGDGKFDPNGTTTRAMLVTILHRMEGKPAAARSAFADVPADRWYTAAVDWAAANKIVEGMDAKTFAPASPVTREQFAVILYRYANFKGMDAAKKADLSAFTDAGKVSRWAADAMAWANATGLIQGVGKSSLDPAGNATRAQAAAILHRFDLLKQEAAPTAAPTATPTETPVSDTPTKQPEPTVPPTAKPGELTLAVDKTDATVTEPKQTFTGSYTVENDQIDRIDWVQHSDVEAYEGVTGTAMIDQTKGTWQAADILLAPGANTITFTGYTKNGAKAEQTVEITYDSGEIADYTNRDITYIDDQGNGYVNNVILVVLDASRSQDERQEAVRKVCSAVDGIVIGALYDIEVYQIRVAKGDEAALTALCDTACKASDVVVAAKLDCLLPDTEISEKPSGIIAPRNSSAVPMAVPSPASDKLFLQDPWSSNQSSALTEADWDENNPVGANWWAEAVRAPSMWAYHDYFYPVTVGIMDGTPYAQHEDLRDVLSFAPSNTGDYRYHGTHVAGLIGAQPHNGKGIAGMCWTANMVSFDVKNQYSNKDTTVKFAWGFQDLLGQGCKVINVSQGYGADTYADLSTLQNRVYNERTFWNQTIQNEINNQREFLIIQSAGNGYDTSNANSSSYYEPFDAQWCGLFGGANSSAARARLMIVAATQEKQDNTAGKEHAADYQLVEWSNTGNAVDVTAPGTEIYSTMYYDQVFLNAHPAYVEAGYTAGDWGYQYQQGTSMSAPIVSGLAAAVWAVNPDFTADNVKSIVKETASTVCYRNSENTTRNEIGYDARETYPMINAQAAVEEALRRTYGDGTLNVSFVNAKDNQPVNNVSYEIRLGSPTGTVVAAGTANVSAAIPLPRAQGTDYHQAQYYIVASNGHDTWTSATASTVNVGQTTNVTAALNVPDKINAYRVVLTWNAEPADLDAHLVAGNGGHVYYKAKSIPGAVMDLDDTQSFGPETITVTDVSALGGFTYSVHDFTNRATFLDASGLADSGATVRVYAGSALVKIYTVPANMNGTVWNVFSVEADGTITDGGAFKYSGNGAAIAGLFPMKPAATAAALSAQPAWKAVEPDKS